MEIDRKFVATCHADSNIWITEISTGRCIRQYTGHTTAPWCLKFHPSSNSTLASGDYGGELRIWNNDVFHFKKGDIVRWYSEDYSPIFSIDFHPSKEILAIASGCAIYFWLWKETLLPTGICCTSSEIERPQYVKFYNSGNSFVTGILNVPKSTCIFVQNKEKVLRDSSNVQIVSSSSVRKNDSQEEVLCDSSNVQIVCSSSVTENNAQEEVLSDSNGDDVKILPINTRSLTNEKSSHGYTKENTLSDASDIEIVYTNINPLDGGNRSYSSTEEPKASQNFRNVNTVEKTSASQGLVNNMRNEPKASQNFRNVYTVGKTSASQGQEPKASQNFRNVNTVEKTSASQGLVNNMRNPFNLTVPDWDPDIQTVGVVLKDGKKVDENADVICEYEFIKTPLSKGMKRKRILKHQYVQGTSKRQKTAVQTRSEVMPFAIRKSREMRIVPIEGRIGVSPTIDDNHITVNPFVLNMMRLQSLFSSLNQRLTIFQSFSIPPLENLIFPQFNETAQFE
ncbi:activating molecule in BECN1-regulated autophagy protein 1 [Trichonephila clavipes]|nr:activating molecule in BECN1-regulated autophagy protein 1 [Trichonephila clavipes]